MSSSIEGAHAVKEADAASALPLKPRLFLRLLKRLQRLRPGAGLERLEHYVRTSLLGTPPAAEDARQQPLGGYYPGLGAKPWYQPEDHPALRRVATVLEEGTPRILRELLARLEQGDEPVRRYEASHRYPTLKGKDWGGLVLWKDGRFTPEGRRHFPETVALVRPLEPLLLPFGELAFLFLKPGVHLPPHHDVTNAQLTCHLGLIIPPDCALRVGTEVRPWEVGRTLFFDHTFEHEAWNRSNSPRAILVMNLLHPELGPWERYLLKFFYRAGLHAAATP